MFSPAAVVDLTLSNMEEKEETVVEEEIGDEEEEEEETQPNKLVGSCQATIVGIRFYSGTAHAGEYVTLLREPNNPYDSNAIRVDNLQNQKVGHIKRQQAVLLADLMDNAAEGSGRLTFEATIPSPGNDYTLPCTIEFFCQAPRDEIDAASKAMAVKLKNIFRSKFSFRSNISLRKTAPQAAPKIESAKMAWTTQADALDNMFDQQTKKQLQDLPQVEVPKQLTTELLPYQNQGLQWLVHHDTTPKTPFFSKKVEKGKHVWYCNITNASQPNEPKACRGGLLCDEQGLGKTLQMIGLMLSAPPSSTQRPQCNLIVCPVSVMSNWEQQIQQHVQPNVLKVGLYQGSGRSSLLTKVAAGEVNVLLVSYHTLAAEFSKVFGKVKASSSGEQSKPPAKKKAKVETIFDHQFHRIILDEAHIIRSTRTGFFLSCCKIAAQSKWALTGTPFVNKAEDVYALLAFLGVDPLNEKQIFQRAISKPMENGNDAGMACLRLSMAHVALRRSKQTANIKLASKTVHLTKVSFQDDTAHKEIYDALFGSVRVAFEAVLNGGDKSALKNYSSIFEKLLRLRQACCSAKLVPLERRQRTMEVWKELQQRSGDASQAKLTLEEGLALLEKLKGAFEQATGEGNSELPECAVCLTEMEETQCVILRTCSHVYCEECIGRVCSVSSPKCPLCRKHFEKADMIKKSVAATAASQIEPIVETKGDLDADSIGPSPKIKALLETIKSGMNSDEKGVIFSQFTSFLDLIGDALKEAGHSFTRLDGSMNAKKRMSAVSAFSSNEEGTPRFILCSLHAAGTGINLTRGSIAFMMDCWWNSSVENQAMDRIHRIGQERPVTIHRIVMKNSLEERIVELQEAKSLQAKGAMQKLKPEEQRQARLRDLKGLLMIEEES